MAKTTDQSYNQYLKIRIYIKIYMEREINYIYGEGSFIKRIELHLIA